MWKISCIAFGKWLGLVKRTKQVMFQGGHLLPLQHQASFLTFLSFSFVISKIEIVTFQEKERKQK